MKNGHTPLQVFTAGFVLAATAFVVSTLVGPTLMGQVGDEDQWNEWIWMPPEDSAPLEWKAPTAVPVADVETVPEEEMTYEVLTEKIEKIRTMQYDIDTGAVDMVTGLTTITEDLKKALVIAEALWSAATGMAPAAPEEMEVMEPEPEPSVWEELVDFVTGEADEGGDVEPIPMEKESWTEPEDQFAAPSESESDVPWWADPSQWMPTTEPEGDDMGLDDLDTGVEGGDTGDDEAFNMAAPSEPVMPPPSGPTTPTTPPSDFNSPTWGTYSTTANVCNDNIPDNEAAAEPNGLHDMSDPACAG